MSFKRNLLPKMAIERLEDNPDALFIDVGVRLNINMLVTLKTQSLFRGLMILVGSQIQKLFLHQFSRN